MRIFVNVKVMRKKNNKKNTIIFLLINLFGGEKKR